MSNMLPSDDGKAIIAWVKEGADRAAYDKSIKPILDKRCMGCHDGSNPHLPNLSSYDNLKKKYVTFWIDSTSTMFYLTEGTRDATAKTVTETGLWPDALTGGLTKVRSVTKWAGPDEFAYEFYMTGADGKEFKTLENRAVRAK